MSEFVLDKTLQSDCIRMFQVDDIHVLLMNNSLVQWIILVPKTHHTELHQLPAEQFHRLMSLQCVMARIIEDNFPIDKINIGAIGNVVSQLHLHVIGRRKNDHCWPGVVWGNPLRDAYDLNGIENMRKILETCCLENGLNISK